MQIRRCRNVVILTAFGLTAAAFAQDTRHVTEPVIPPSCVVIPAHLDYDHDALRDGDSAALDTAAIQNAINHCASGHAVELKPADGHNALVTGPLTLRSGVTLVLDRGLHLVASNNPADYDRSPGSCGLTNHKGGGCRPLFSATHVNHTGLMGDGIVEGRGNQKLHGLSLTWWQMHDQIHGDVQHNIPWLIGTEASNDFTLYRITLHNAPNFNVFLQGGDGITVWGVKIDAPGNSPNTDGIDPSGCTNVTIVHSFIRNGDDNVAIKAPKGHPSAHITVADDHFYEGHGMSIGSGTEGGVSDVRFTNLTIDHQKAGIHIKSNPGRGGLVTNVVYDHVCVRNTATPIDLESTYIDANAPQAGWVNGHAFPQYTHIVLRHVTTEGGSRLRVMGIDAAHAVDVQLDGVWIGGMEAMQQQVQHAHITLGPGPTNWLPHGEDVTIAGKPAGRTPPRCEAGFEDFPSLTPDN